MLFFLFLFLFSLWSIHPATFTHPQLYGFCELLLFVFIFCNNIGSMVCMVLLSFHVDLIKYINRLSPHFISNGWWKNVKRTKENARQRASFTQHPPHTLPQPATLFRSFSSSISIFLDVSLFAIEWANGENETYQSQDNVSKSNITMNVKVMPLSSAFAPSHPNALSRFMNLIFCRYGCSFGTWMVF